MSDAGNGGSTKSSVLGFFLKGGLGITFVGALGTLIGAYFHDLQAYENKVTA